MGGVGGGGRGAGMSRHHPMSSKTEPLVFDVFTVRYASARSTTRGPTFIRYFNGPAFAPVRSMYTIPSFPLAGPVGRRFALLRGVSS